MNEDIFLQVIIILVIIIYGNQKKDATRSSVETQSMLPNAGNTYIYNIPKILKYYAWIKFKVPVKGVK